MQTAKKIIINVFLLSILSFFYGSNDLFADEASEIKEMTSVKVDQIISMLRSENLSKEEKKLEIFKKLDALIDFNLMAKLCLGKKHWKRLSKEGRVEFAQLLVERLKQSYLDKLDLYTDEEVEVVEARKTGKNRVEILTNIVGIDTKLEMVFKFYKSKNKGWMVYDAVILGVSIVQTYRSQFSGILKKESLEKLIERLRSSTELGS